MRIEQALTDLTQEAHNGDFEKNKTKDKDVAEIWKILVEPRRHNVLMIAREENAEAVVEQLSNQIANESIKAVVPNEFQMATVLSLDLEVVGLLATYEQEYKTMSALNEALEKMQDRYFSDLKNTDIPTGEKQQPIILFIKNIDTCFRSNGGNLLEPLKSSILKGVRVIGSVFPDTYNMVGMTIDMSLAGFFQNIDC